MQEVGIRGSGRDGRAHHPLRPAIGRPSGWPLTAGTNETACQRPAAVIRGSRGWAELPKAVSLPPQPPEPDVSSGAHGWSSAPWISAPDAGLAEGRGPAEWSLAKVRIRFSGGQARDWRKESHKSQDGSCPGPRKVCDLGVMAVSSLSQGAQSEHPCRAHVIERAQISKNGSSEVTLTLTIHMQALLWVLLLTSHRPQV